MRIFSLLLSFALCVCFWLTAPCIAGEQGLRLGMDEWPPYEYTTAKGEISGIATQIVLEVFSRMGASVQGIESFPWARGLRRIEAGQLDVLFSGIYDESRLYYVRYPKVELIISRWVFFVRKEDRAHLAYNSLDDLKGHRVGVVRDYFYTPAFNEYIENNRDIVTVSSDRANLELLLRGRVDYALCDYLNCLQLLNAGKLKDQLSPLEETPLADIRLYPLFNLATISQAFVDRFDEVLQGFKQEARYLEIINENIQ
ncbi:MAG: transporter substrate-binding domain-containing protein [Proteobacteria bacterium]|nr:transporter substrate-binding domain-containing protein [Pseudomonadota bacterium]